jgi:hypothetical protein
MFIALPSTGFEFIDPLSGGIYYFKIVSIKISYFSINFQLDLLVKLKDVILLS